MTQGVAKHPEKELMQELWVSGLRAKAIIDHLEQNDLPTVSYKALAKYGQRNWSERLEIKVNDKETDFISDLLFEIDEAGLGSIDKVTITKKHYPGWDKIDGESVQVEKEALSHTIVVKPEKESTEPEYVEVIDRAKIPSIKIPSKGSRSSSKPLNRKLAVSIPDMQIGAAELNTGALEPTQDERALDVAFQILKYMEDEHGIDLLVNLGDNLDFPAFSSHRSAPSYVTNRTTQYAIDRAGTLIATERAICEEAEIIWLAGNHEIRLLNALIDKIPPLVGLARANDEEPVLSISYLLRCEDYNVKYIDGYPDGEYWACKNLRFEHGSKISSSPGTTAKNHLREGVSTIYGHHHHQELLYLTAQLKDREVISFAGSPGHLARQDGFLPSAKTSATADNKQATRHGEAWQQGIWFVWYDPEGNEDPELEPIKIQNGKAIFRGMLFSSSVDN